MLSQGEQRVQLFARMLRDWSSKLMIRSHFGIRSWFCDYIAWMAILAIAVVVVACLAFATASCACVWMRTSFLYRVDVHKVSPGIILKVVWNWRCSSWESAIGWGQRAPPWTFPLKTTLSRWLRLPRWIRQHQSITRVSHHGPSNPLRGW